MAAHHEPPFIQDFRDIAEGRKPMPTTDARRQHYVPSFLLARWATPQTRRGSLASLTVATGNVAARQPGKVALETDLYTIDTHAASANLVFEAFLAIVESHAADPIKRLATAPQAISGNDRATIAYFLALQQGRTPPGLAQHRTVAEAAAEQALHAFFQDRTAVATHYRKTVNPAADFDEIRAFAIREIEAVRDGRRTIELPEEAPLQAMIAVVSAIALTVVQMSWTLLTSEAEFIANDRGLAMWDPDLGTGGHAWLSSPQAETTFPVAPSACLKLTPGEEAFTVEHADAASVDKINLRTYGWANAAIFGTDEQVLRNVHNAASGGPDAVPRPVVPVIHHAVGAPNSAES